jgi:hypothetical protein
MEGPGLSWDDDVRARLCWPVGRVLAAIAAIADDHGHLIDLGFEPDERLARVSSIQHSGTLTFRLHPSPSKGTDLTLQARGAWPHLEGLAESLGPADVRTALHLIVVRVATRAAYRDLDHPWPPS